MKKVGEKTGNYAFYEKIYRRIGDVGAYYLNRDFWDFQDKKPDFRLNAGLWRMGRITRSVIQNYHSRRVCPIPIVVL